MAKEHNKQDRYKMLTETPVPQLICRLAVPTIITMLITGLYNSVDTYFVGQISTQATAAVGLAFSVMSVIQALGFFCGQGSGNYLSRMLGAGRKKEACDMAATSLALAFIIGIAMAALGNIFIEPVAAFLGASETTMADTISYMRIILIGAPFVMGQFVINNQLRFQGAAVYAMYGVLSGALLNIVLDPLLIFGLHMGVAGAAWATIIGQLIGFIVLLVGSFKGENIRLSLSNVHFTAHNMIELVNGGAPSLFRQGMASVAAILLNRAAGQYGGDAAIAGMSVTTRVMMLMMSALIGFGQGYQPVCSFNYGAGLKKRVKEGFYFCLKVSIVFLTVVGAVFFVFAPQVIAFFRNDPEVIAIGAVALRYQTAVLPLMGVVVMSNMMLQSTGMGLKATITSSARNGIFFIPLILILPPILGLFGVEITQSVADIFSFALALPLAMSELRKM